jgi:putative acetyltransferase
MDYLMKHDIFTVELTVAIDNEGAKNLYRKAGFVIVEKLENEYGENTDRYLMRYSAR